DYPIGLVQDGYGGVIRLGIDACGGLDRREYPVGLVREGEDEVGLEAPARAEAIEEGEAVDHVPRVDDEGEDGDLRDPRAGREESDGHELGGSREDHDAHQRREPPGLPRFDQEETEGYPYSRVAEEDGHARREGGPEGRSALNWTHSPGSSRSSLPPGGGRRRSCRPQARVCGRTCRVSPRGRRR